MIFAVINIGENEKVSVPAKYTNFENLFKKEKNKKALPKHQL
jgi:hypothetical protein